MTDNLKSRLERRRRYSFELSRKIKNPSIQASLTVFLSVLLVVVFLVFAIQPTLVKIAELKKQIAESEKVLAQLKNKANALSAIAAEWSTLETKLPYLESAIPYGPHYRTLNKELVVLAYRNKVEMVNLNMGEALVYAQLMDPYKIDKKMGVVPVGFTLRVAGDYSLLMSFLREMMMLDRVIRIDGVTLAPETQTSVNSKYPLSMNLTGVAYYLAETKQLVPIIDVTGKDKK